MKAPRPTIRVRGGSMNIGHITLACLQYTSMLLSFTYDYVTIVPLMRYNVFIAEMFLIPLDKVGVRHGSKEHWDNFKKINQFKC